MNGPSERLLRSAVAGDGQAVEALIRLHEPHLLAFVRANAGPALRARESVRDILQEILLEVVKGLGTLEYRGEAEFRGWLYTLAERRIRDRARHFRSRKRDGGEVKPLEEADEERILAEGYSSLGGPARELARREDIERLEAALGRLSADDRAVLSLAYFCGMRASALAEHLGISVAAARKRRLRAQVRLAACWGLDGAAP